MVAFVFTTCPIEGKAITPKGLTCKLCPIRRSVPSFRKKGLKRREGQVCGDLAGRHGESEQAVCPLTLGRQERGPSSMGRGADGADDAGDRRENEEDSSRRLATL